MYDCDRCLRAGGGGLVCAFFVFLPPAGRLCRGDRRCSGGLFLFVRIYLSVSLSRCLLVCGFIALSLFLSLPSTLLPLLNAAAAAAVAVHFTVSLLHKHTRTKADSSANLRRLLAVVLAVGNLLNEGTGSGDAKAITLESLLKITTVRCAGQTWLNMAKHVLNIAKNGETLLVRSVPANRATCFAATTDDKTGVR